MQELEFVPGDSDATSLVLRVPGSAEDGERFLLEVTGPLKEILTASPTTGGIESAGAGQAADTTPTSTGPAVRPLSGAADGRGGGTAPKERREKVRLRPRDIQKRLRHGATVAELAAETGEPESRLLPYAHPIEMERHRIAQLARDAYPVRADGPAEHTLWEVLATAFGARGEDVRAAEWDAAMDSSDAWIVTVTWTRGNRRGATQFVAEFRWVPARRPGAGPSTVEPANSVAGDLIDPRFNRPVRSVTPVPGAGEPGDGFDGNGDVVDDVFPTDGDAAGNGGTGDNGATGADGDTGVPGPARRDGSTVDLFGDAVGRSPSHPSRRRKGAATPHWEDVLLGVRNPPRRRK
ncbi:septation protein SepH [Corynebacterium neomassiliense]|uniref:septation protein SepH n=1 Tax=Corynebacterium neomassiliense TaxID=2079482 RepID=UPI0010309387|nr:septation protein SepH [Corynebacterium neomassiliense]